MWFLYGGLAFVWIAMMITLGIQTLRNGHVVLFVVGLFLPFCWVIGALLSRPSAELV